MLVCGGRDFKDYGHLCRVLDSFHAATPVRCVIHGGASGADELAGQWARSREIAITVFPANWILYGKGAGMIRNRSMLTDGRPDLVIAFRGGKGTANMIGLARAAGVRVHTSEQ